ncbi:MAG: DUF4261 domain-containing protein [Propionibacteriaceae bacterium]
MSKNDRRFSTAHLLLSERPSFEETAIREAISAAFPNAEVSIEDGALHIAHLDVMQDYPDGQQVPLVTVGIVEQGAPDMEFSQSWSVSDDLRKAATESRWELLIAELLTDGHSAADRVRSFAGIVATLTKLFSPTAIWCTHSGQLVAPEELLSFPAGLAFNLRIFQVADGDDGAFIIDTLGLDVLGLPDLQIHTRDLSPQDLAGQLGNIALYLLKEGDVVADGSTIDGISAAPVWGVTRTQSMTEPHRTVLSFDPGAPYSPTSNTSIASD